MASVVIVHAAEDTPPARALAEKLRRMGVQPVVEQTGDALHAAIRNAQALVALWSPRSAQSPGMVDDVRFARTVAPVIHARMQNAATPADFGGDASIDLTGWRGEDEFGPWRALAAALAEKTGVAMPPAPAPRPAPAPAASPFFQPGAPPRQAAPAPTLSASPVGPRPVPARPAAAPAPVMTDAEPIARFEPRSAPPRTAFDDSEPQSGRGGKLALIAIVTFIVVAALGGGGYFAWSQMQGSQASSAAWEHLDKSNPEALRAFLRDNPGALRDQAQGTLDALEATRYATARQTDTVDAYNAFLSAFPHSDHALEARGRIAELQSAPQAPSTTDPLTGFPTTTTTTDPDLLPPGASPDQLQPPAQQQPPPPTTGGPVTLTPPDPTPIPSDTAQPTN